RAADSIAARCEAAADLTGVYDPVIAGEIEAALTGAGLSYGARTWETIRGRLGEQAAALTEARRQSCLGAAADAGDAPLVAARTICLDRRRSELWALASVLRRADDRAVEQAV